jgi:DNA-binding transcriptional regulator/RsmH inhibitor MraZ
MYGAWALCAMLFLIGGSMLLEARHAIKVVGEDTAPSIISAQEISFALADLDANAANYLLGSKQHQLDAKATFEKQRVVATTSLVKAANNITYEAEKPPINTLFDGLGRYLELYAEMRYRQDSGDAAGAVTTYLTATDLMHQTMLPAAEALNKVNFDALKTEYDHQQFNSEGAEVIAGLIAAGLGGLLLWAQWFLYQRMRRVFNVPLVVATALTALFGGYLVFTIGDARHDLKVAKEDAFDSIHAMWQAASIAYDANGDESRWLLGGPRKQSFDLAYRTKVARLTTKTQVTDGFFSGSASRIPKEYQGFFADEMRNITFKGEREAALKMIREFAAYDALDTKMRALELSGKHAEAVELCIGKQDNQSDATFDRFDKALHAVIDINHKQFDSAVKTGIVALEVAAVILPIICLAVAFLALFGIRARLREYAT